MKRSKFHLFLFYRSTFLDEFESRSLTIGPLLSAVFVIAISSDRYEINTKCVCLSVPPTVCPKNLMLTLYLQDGMTWNLVWLDTRNFWWGSVGSYHDIFRTLRSKVKKSCTLKWVHETEKILFKYLKFVLYVSFRLKITRNLSSTDLKGFLISRSVWSVLS